MVVFTKNKNIFFTEDKKYDVLDQDGTYYCLYNDWNVFVHAKKDLFYTISEYRIKKIDIILKHINENIT